VAKGHTACGCENEMMQIKCKYCVEIKAAANKLQEKVLRSVCSLQILLATQLFFATAVDGNGIHVQLKILFVHVSSANAKPHESLIKTH